MLARGLTRPPAGSDEGGTSLGAAVWRVVAGQELAYWDRGVSSSLPGPGLGGAEDQARHPGMHQRAGAHRAGFHGDVQRRSHQPVVARPSCGLAQRQYLGVGRGVAIQLAPVATERDETRTIKRAGDEHRTDWHVPMSRRCTGLLESEVHVAEVVRRQGRNP